MIKPKVAFLEGRFFPINQGFLKTFQIALIGWINAGPPKKPLLFSLQSGRLSIANRGFFRSIKGS